MSDYIQQLDAVLTSGNRPLLVGGGSVSHAQAMEKATTEYRKYQNNTLSPVEHFYLDMIKSTAKEVKRQRREKKWNWWIDYGKDEPKRFKLGYGSETKFAACKEKQPLGRWP